MKLRSVLLVMFSSALVAACGGGGSSSRGAPPPAAPNPVDFSGIVLDGPVVGGSIYAFSPDRVQAALAEAAGAEDRAAALAGAGPIGSLTRSADGDESYTMRFGEDRAGETVFLIFDAAGAQDEAFGDEPFNLETVAVLGDPGSVVRANLTPHTTLISAQVRAALDPDGDGTIISAAELATAIDNATAATVQALPGDDLGETVLQAGVDPVALEDAEALLAASLHVGKLVRVAAALAGGDRNDVVAALAADAADGDVDGAAPMPYQPDEDLLAAVGTAGGLGAPGEEDAEQVGCAASSHQLRRACEFEVLDEFMVSLAGCADTSDAEGFAACSEALAEEREESLEECGDVTDARLALCETLDDAPHNPPFGDAFASSFVDPRQIGTAVAPNPLFPLVIGNQWVYEGTFEEDGEMVTETITIDVLDETKRIQGIDCLVVRDVVVIDGELIEDTDDWIAQDVDGNLWYCGEEVKDYETFDGDEPALPELVAIDGAFKAGRDGDKAGILLPGVAEVGAVFRQEVSFANAEDVIEILSVSGSATTPAANCSGNCVVTRDFSPLDPGVEENKYYLPGVGKILEVNLETGDQVALISTNVVP